MSRAERSTQGRLGRSNRNVQLSSMIAAAIVVASVALATPASAATGAADVSAGFSHTCALTSSGGVKCWGSNDYGELGNGTRVASLKPVGVSGMSSRVAKIGTGVNYSCALTTSGGVRCWGNNSVGQLGNGTTTSSSTPVQVTGLSSGVAAISVGTNFACALTTSGDVKCWGSGSHGRLGDATLTSSSTPVAVSGLSGVTSISLGYMHACALTASGAVSCWGWNNYGELGDGTLTESATPVQVIELSDVGSISAGGYHTCAVTTAGGATCWGQGSYGELGDGTATDSSTPVAVSGLSSGVASIAGGAYHTCAVTTTGSATCWGTNSVGQLGNGATTNSSTPVGVTGLSSGVAAISAGRGHTCAVDTSATLKCWGWNIYGQLGNGATTNSSTPVGVSGFSK